MRSKSVATRLCHPPVSGPVEPDSSLGQIQGDHFGVLLGAFENEFACVWRDVEVANVEVGREVGQGALRACVEVDEPEIFVFNLSLQEHE
jgi:hypothetical protein